MILTVNPNTEWMVNNKKGIAMKLPENGFGGISLRTGKKPIIAAVNGPAYGGGCEMVVNCDMVVASSTASFALPETKRGLTPFAGALPRLVSIVGRQRATEMALTGRAITAEEARDWGLCNFVTSSNHDDSVVDKAVEFAKAMAQTSPDAMIVTREGLKLAWGGLGIVGAGKAFLDGWASKVYDGPNVQEGLNAFTEKRPPCWKDSKL